MLLGILDQSTNNHTTAYQAKELSCTTARVRWHKTSHKSQNIADAGDETATKARLSWAASSKSAHQTLDESCSWPPASNNHGPECTNYAILQIWSNRLPLFDCSQDSLYVFAIVRLRTCVFHPDLQCRVHGIEDSLCINHALKIQTKRRHSSIGFSAVFSPFGGPLQRLITLKHNPKAKGGSGGRQLRPHNSSPRVRQPGFSSHRFLVAAANQQLHGRRSQTVGCLHHAHTNVWYRKQKCFEFHRATKKLSDIQTRSKWRTGRFANSSQYWKLTHILFTWIW